MRRGASDPFVRDAVRRAKSGDRGAIEYLYVRYAGDVRRHVADIVGNAHDAEDITQNVFARLHDSIRQYEERSVSFRAWLRRVAANAALDELRRRRAIPMSELPAGRSSASGDTGPDVAAALTEALASLPEEQRAVLLLRHLAGLSPAEIAERLGRSEDSVHSLHYRGRDSAKAKLKRLGAGPSTMDETRR